MMVVGLPLLLRPVWMVGVMDVHEDFCLTARQLPLAHFSISATCRRCISHFLCVLITPRAPSSLVPLFENRICLSISSNPLHLFYISPKFCLHH